MGRAAAVLALLVALGVYYGVAGRLPDIPLGADYLFLSLGLLPAAFALVWLALPLRRTQPARLLGLAVVALAALAAVLEVADLEIAANFAKFAAVALAGWWFLGFFEAVSWVVLVALLIVPVDAFSVEAGPTKHIVEQEPQVFDALSVAFPVPGEPSSANLGLPDVLFFALFLGAAERFHLRVGPTWAAMTLSFAGTLGIAIWAGRAGLAALPLLSAAFVLVNADRLWRAWSSRRDGPHHPTP